MGTNRDWARRELDGRVYIDNKVLPAPGTSPPPGRAVGEPAAQQPPLGLDAIAWFEQRGVRFGRDAKEPRGFRGGYIVRLTHNRALIAPITTIPGAPHVKYALPTGDADGMCWYRNPQLQRFVFKFAEHVKLDFYSGKQQGQANLPTSERVRAFVRGPRRGHR